MQAVDELTNLKRTLRQFSCKLKKRDVGMLRALLVKAVEQYGQARPALENDLAQQKKVHKSIRNSFMKDYTKGWFVFRQLLPEARRLIRAIYLARNRKIKKGIHLANQLELWQKASNCSLRFIFWLQPGQDTPEWTMPMKSLRWLPPDHDVGLEQEGSVPLAGLFIRHATTVSGFLKMLAAVDETEPPRLHFKGLHSPAQYRGAPLAWFGLVLPERYQNPNEAVQERYGTVLFTIPCEVLLRERQKHLWLGWRKYTKELSQTVLVVDDENYDASTEDGWLFSAPREQGVNHSLAEVAPKGHWPAAYRPDLPYGRWAHPEFAVHNGLTLSPADEVRAKFQNHIYCVKKITGRRCFDCRASMEGVTAAEAWNDFVARVRQKNLIGALYRFQMAFRAFSNDDWLALEQAIAQAKNEDENEHDGNENENENENKNENENESGSENENGSNNGCHEKQNEHEEDEREWIGSEICSESEIEDLVACERDAIKRKRSEWKGDEHEQKYNVGEPISCVTLTESEMVELHEMEMIEREWFMKLGLCPQQPAAEAPSPLHPPSTGESPTKKHKQDGP